MDPTTALTVIGTGAAVFSATADMHGLARSLKAAQDRRGLLQSILPQSEERKELEMTLDDIQEVITWLTKLEELVRTTRNKDHIRVFKRLRIDCARNDRKWGELVDEQQRLIKSSTGWNFSLKAIFSRDDRALKQIKVLHDQVLTNRFGVVRTSNSIRIELFGADMPVEGIEDMTVDVHIETVPPADTITDSDSTPQHSVQTEASLAAERLSSTLSRWPLQAHKVSENEQTGSLIAMTPLRKSITLSLKSQLSEPALDPLGAVASFSSDQRRDEKESDCATNKRSDVSRTDAGEGGSTSVRNKSTAATPSRSPDDR